MIAWINMGSYVDLSWKKKVASLTHIMIEEMVGYALELNKWLTTAV